MTAKACYGKALQIAHHTLQKYKKDDKITCPVCLGEKKTFPIWDLKDIYPPPKGTYLQQIKDLMTKKEGCSTCSQSGILNKNDYQELIMHDYIFCKCLGEKDLFYTPDGKKLFGGDTYLCRKCGMVGILEIY